MVKRNVSVLTPDVSLLQVTPCKASGLRRFVQAAQLVVQKSSRRACQLFCCPVDAAPRERLARGPGN